ncbi:MAG: ABC transporter permease [Calditrichaeota bacterium]|nr:MAG: ABC transporter permease [Calditrichota bacterium]
MSNKSESFTAVAYRQFKKSKFGIAGFYIVLLLFITSILALFDLTPFSYTEGNIENILQPVSSVHWFGTDDLGRDVFSRVVEGSVISLSVGIGAMLISLVIGVFLGALAGFYGKWVDLLIMQVTDIFLSFPTILFALAVIAIFEETTIATIIYVLGFLGWPGICRLLRGKILQVREEEYVAAAKALGMNDFQVIFKHVLPNAVAPLMVATTVGIAGNILSEAWLSFLGIGVPPPEPSWGRMISEGQNQLATNPEVCIFSGLAIFITVMAFNLLGDGLRDAIDPKLKI